MCIEQTECVVQCQSPFNMSSFYWEMPGVRCFLSNSNDAICVWNLQSAYSFCGHPYKLNFEASSVETADSIPRNCTGPSVALFSKFQAKIFGNCRYYATLQITLIG